MLKSRYAGLLLCALAGAHCGAHAAYVVPSGTMTDIQSNFSSLYTARNDGADRLTLTEVRRKILEQTAVFRPEDVIPVPCHPETGK